MVNPGGFVGFGLIKTIHRRRWVCPLNVMAVLTASDNGWIISHEIFIKNIYKKTKYLNEVKSFHLQPVLFDIKIPFLKEKHDSKNGDKAEVSDVGVVKKSYESLFKLYQELNKCSAISQTENNLPAKSLADRFYTQLTRHPNSKFFGGNSSQEALVCEVEEELYLIPEESLFYCYDVRDIADHLSDKKFDLILMDPPWWNKYIRRKRKKNYKFGYDMVYDKELSSIPVNLLLSDNGLIAVWCTSSPSHINFILNELLPAWGVEYIGQWFWLKITKFGKLICAFSESLKKQPFERIIFGVKKNSSRSLPNPESNKVIMSVPSAIHSHKPPLCELLTPYLPEEPKCLELFARYLLPGWTSYGNEVLKLQHLSLYTEESTKNTS